MPLTSAELSALEPPDGWEWVSKPSLRSTGRIKLKVKLTFPDIQERLLALNNWALVKQLGVTGVGSEALCPSKPSTATLLRHGGYGVYTEFRVKANAPARTRAFFGAFSCWNCGRANVAGTVQCSYCTAAYCCNVCGNAGGMPYYRLDNSSAVRRSVHCAACTSKCKTPHCANRTVKSRSKCNVCDPPLPCHTCGEYFSKDVLDTEILPGKNTCVTCVKLYKCPECKVYRPNQKITVFGGKSMCSICKDELEDGERKKLEVIDADQMPSSGSMVIVTSKVRPYRSISIETELNGDKGTLARTLYRCGIIHQPRVESYHSHPDLNEGQYVGFLKHDGSVSGGELILSLLRLDNEDHATALLDVLKVLNSLKSMKKVECSENCGGHIHVDAHNFPYGCAWRLLTVFNYLEDAIFRLAGGDAPYGHRTLTTKQREVAQAHGHQEGYTRSPVKGPFGSKSVFGKSIEQMGRTSALNFQPYLEARHNCRCGAHLAEDSRNCTCNLGKSTIEWRVFNSTINPRILHGWVAFIQAMMAYASEENDPDVEWEKEHPSLPWAQLPFSQTGAEHRNALKVRLEWIFTHLMLTDEERDSLIYCIGQSDMHDLGEDYIESLRALKPTHDFLVKPEVRNPAKRRRKIKISPPDPSTMPPLRKMVHSSWD